MDTILNKDNRLTIKKDIGNVSVTVTIKRPPDEIVIDGVLYIFEEVDVETNHTYRKCNILGAMEYWITKGTNCDLIACYSSIDGDKSISFSHVKGEWVCTERSTKQPQAEEIK